MVVSTGQHTEMVREILAMADIVPDVELAADTSGSLNDLTGSVMSGFQQFCEQRYDHDGTNRVNALDIDDVFGRGYPGGVLVHGDTSSAMAEALASFHLRIPVGHVEAGLRTGSTLSPWPEELNRQLISRIAAFHLAPTDLNKQNLIREGVDADRVFVTGNTGIDTLVKATELPSNITDERILQALDDPRPLVVATAHRRENWRGGLARIGSGLRLLVEQHPEVQIVLVTHPNPAARAEVSAPVEGLEQVIVTGPLEYTPFAHLLANAYFAISDSGGVQEEAPALGTPVLVTRDTTERTEGLEAGTLRLVGTESTAIAGAAHELLTDPRAHDAMAFAANPYGDGKAARRVLAALENLAGRAPDPVRYGSGFNRTKVLQAGGYPGTSAVQSDVVVPLEESR